MNRSIFLNFISKYNIFGISRVRYIITDKISCRFKNDFDLLGIITMDSFKNKIDISGNEIGLQDSSLLESLIKISDSDEIEVDIRKITDKPIALKISDDRELLIDFALHDMATIPEIAPIKGEPKDYQVELKLDEVFKSKFIDARNAMSKQGETATITSDGNVCKVVIGQKEFANSTKITLVPKTIRSEKMDDFIMNSDTLRNIFVVNKNIESTLYLSNTGVAKVSFVDEEKNITSTYYIKRLN